ncbi:KH domain-containing protein [Tanacetum coccineum]
MNVSLTKEESQARNGKEFHSASFKVDGIKHGTIEKVFPPNFGRKVFPFLFFNEITQEYSVKESLDTTGETSSQDGEYIITLSNTMNGSFVAPTHPTNSSQHDIRMHDSYGRTQYTAATRTSKWEICIQVKILVKMKYGIQMRLRVPFSVAGSFVCPKPLSSSALEMLVPGHAVGNVMGRGQANVDNTQASVEISDNKSSCGDRVAVILGKPEQKRTLKA